MIKHPIFTIKFYSEQCQFAFSPQTSKAVFFSQNKNALVVFTEMK